MVSSDLPAAAPGRVAFDLREGVAVLTIDNPPVKAGALGVRRGVVAGIAAAQRAGARAAVLIGAGRTFMSGWDLREIARPLEQPELPEMIACIEDAPFPVVAALHGQALGGGLELALGCDWRIAVPGTRVGLPEVSLGLIPGAGGTQRLPRLVGQSRAIDLICRAARIPAEEALDIGLIDAIVEGELLEAALAFLSETRGKRLAKTLTPPKEPPEAIDAAARKMVVRGGNRPNVTEAIRLVRASTGDADATLAEERAAFHRLRQGADALALRHLFFAERKAATVEGLDMGQARDVTRVGVVGGGTMGQGIARAFLAVDLPVTLVERDQEALTTALDRTRAGIDRQVALGRLSQTQADARKAALSGTVEHAGLTGCDLVVEAVFEDMAVKRALLASLEQHLSDSVILATNTSYLDIDEMADGLTHPDSLCEAGRLGRKTGKGWYDHSGGKPEPDPEVAALIAAARADAGISPRSYDAETIQRQLLAAIVNEAACLLDEGIAQRASDVDVVLTNGYGFPRWRGGPLYWAARQARSTLEADLADLAQAIGHGFRAGPVARTLDQIEIPTEGQ